MPDVIEAKVPSIAVILTWPEITNAEYEVVQRICVAARNIGARATIVDNDGYPIWSTFENVERSAKRIDEKMYDFAISLHFESPRLFDVYSYVTLWNPPEYYFLFGYEKSVMKLTSHNDILSCDSKLADNHASNLFGSLDRSFLTPMPTMFHAPPEPYLQPTLSPSSRLFYIGINWERLGGPKGRHHDLLEQLDEEGLIVIFGPDLFQGGRPWEGFKTYAGPIPFDGKTVIKRLNEAGICLAFSGKAHQRSGIMSNRLFEGLAAGTVVIANRHPFIDRYFSDCVFVVDDEILDPRELKDAVRDIVLQVRGNPEAARRRALAGQDRLRQLFSLERSLERLVREHKEREATARPYLHVEDQIAVSVVAVFTHGTRDSFEDMLQNVLRQKGVAIDLIVICDERFSENNPDIFDDLRRAVHTLSVQTDKFYEIAEFRKQPARRLIGTGPVVERVLRGLKTDLFALLRGDDHWFSDHLASLALALRQHASATFAAAGLIVEEAAQDGRTARRLESLSFRNQETTLFASGVGQYGRYLFRREIVSQLRSATMMMLDGEEGALLAASALSQGDACESNYATYVSLEHRRWRLPQPVTPQEEQQQFIRDSLLARKDWQALRARTAPAPKVVYATTGGAPLRWERYVNAIATEAPIDLDRFYATSLSGDGLPFLYRGFSVTEVGSVWIEDDVAEIRFRLVDAPTDLALELRCFSRSIPVGRPQQGIAVALNDLPIGYCRLGVVEQCFRIPLPPKLLQGGGDSKISINPDWAEPITDASGQIIDPRRLSMALTGFALVKTSPALQFGHSYRVAANGHGLMFLLNGFSHPEEHYVWVDGEEAALSFQLPEDQDSAELVLGLFGRPSPDGQNQRCSVEVDGVMEGEYDIAPETHQIVVPLRTRLRNGATHRVKLKLAFAHQVETEDGKVLDPRRLSIALSNIEIRKTI